jgi:DNA (cytosine-5)-methyltransferase 1
MLNGLDVFTGIGGVSLALKDWVRPIAYCELDPYCQSVLLSRMESGDLCNAPVWDDIRTFPTYDNKLGGIDIIYAGFPCQDISIAGNGKGLDGERSGLFFEIMRLAKEIKPRFIFLENVPAIVTRGGLRVVREIAEMGYDCRWCVISAASVGASHIRKRWFLLAHSKSERSQERGQSLRTQEMLPRYNRNYEHEIWNKEPESKFELAGMVDGIPNRSHRIKALGNAVVPIQAKEAFMILMGLK